MARRSAPRCEQVGRKRVAQRVRADPVAGAAGGHVAPHQPVHAAGRQAPAAIVQEQRVLRRSMPRRASASAAVSSPRSAAPTLLCAPRRSRPARCAAHETARGRPARRGAPRRRLVERHDAAPCRPSRGRAPSRPERLTSSRSRPTSSLSRRPRRRTARGSRDRAGRAGAPTSGISSSRHLVDAEVRRDALLTLAARRPAPPDRASSTPRAAR